MDGINVNGKDHQMAPATGLIHVAMALTEATTPPPTKKLMNTASLFFHDACRKLPNTEVSITCSVCYVWIL